MENPKLLGYKAMRIFSTLLIIFTFSMSPVSAIGFTVGPYDGKVVDSQTNEPVGGAAVFMFWLKTIPNHFEGGTTLPCAMSLIYTDSNGNYSAPAQNCDLGLSSSLESTEIAIYKPGYIAYLEQEIHFDPYGWDEGPHQFTQKDNLVRLERIPAVFDFQKHSKQIRSKLDMLDEYRTVNTGSMMTQKLEIIGAIPEKKEFLSLIEWEICRPEIEERR